MQSWARDNTAANTEHYLQATKVLVIVLCLYSLWQLHLDTETLIFWYFFLSRKLYYVVALSLSRS